MNRLWKITLLIISSISLLLFILLFYCVPLCTLSTLCCCGILPHCLFNVISVLLSLIVVICCYPTVEVSILWDTSTLLLLTSGSFLFLVYYGNLLSRVFLSTDILYRTYSRWFPICESDTSQSVVCFSFPIRKCLSIDSRITCWFTFNRLILNHESYHNICRSPLNLRFMTGTIRSPEFRPIT